MLTVPENQRIAELRRLGVSEPLIRLASGECVHEIFRHRCLGPPYYVYHGAGTPDGPPLVPLWDDNDWVVGVREVPDGLEFVRFDIEDPLEYKLLARTEQGFWATQLDFIYECDAPVEEMQQAAAAVGFRFLDRHLTSRETIQCHLGTFEQLASWLRELVAGIDRESGSPV